MGKATNRYEDPSEAPPGTAQTVPKYTPPATASSIPSIMPMDSSMPAILPVMPMEP